ncbi:MAG TPA: M50 family metallopeptidase, partial [Thermoplasmata archaeon]|nr:M50 family metallopeptidase [Thermoplasmata archaeon]
IVVVALLSIDAVIALRVPASAAPQPAEALGIPGVNPFIPIGYGIVALVIGIVFHEMLHGVVARSQGIGVKSVGILWFVVPIGAFVEQNEAEMLAARRRPRARVAAAGVLANFALTVVFFLALSALVAGSVAPNATGVGVAYVLPGYPAQGAGLAAGDIITSVNGTPTPTSGALFEALANTSAHQTVDLTYFSSSQGRSIDRPVTLASLSRYTNVSSDASKAFLGVSTTFLTPAQLKGVFVDPLASPYGPILGATYWLVLPIAGLEPVQGSTLGFYHVTGPMSALGPGGFWLVANVLFWLAWMNLLLGLSNALPLVPLDGGLLFRDFASGTAARFRRGLDAARLDRIGGIAVAASSALVLFLLVWQFVAPHL